MKVVEFALSPPPPALSAAEPAKTAGMVDAVYAEPFTGDVTDAVIGAVLSRVKVTAVPVRVLPTLSVAVAWTV